MNNALLYLSGLVVVVLAALFAVPTFIDWNGYRGVFEERAAHVFGRDVRVGGTVNVRLLPAPYVQFEKLRISDKGEDGDALFRADSFKMWLSVPPLLKGILQANEIELKRPVLRLAADASGGGNWSTLSFAAGTLPFVPADVTLDQVKITDGVLSLNGAKGDELARIDAINGELTAEALEGPYKFKGRVNWDGGERDVRLSTARSEPNGDIRFKTSVQVAGSRNSYVIDGRVADLKRQPRVEGELTAKIAFGTSAPPAASADAAATATKTGDGVRASGFDVRGKVTGNTGGFRVQDLVMSLERTGPPQIVTGEAGMAWSDKVKVDVALDSKWLDLDSAAEGSKGAKPLEAAQMLFQSLADLLPTEAETNVAMRLDQLNLGAQAVSGVRLKVVRAGGPMELKEFRASVPGGGRLAVDGVLTLAERPARFDGNLTLDGHSATRFLTWAFLSPTIGEGRTDGPFALSGRLRLADTLVELKNAKADIGALPLRGDIRLDLSERRRLALTLEGQTIDLAQFAPGSVGVRVLDRIKSGAGETGSEGEAQSVAASPGLAVFDPTRSDIALKVRAGRLVDGDRVLRNVTADLVLEGNRLAAEALRFSTEDGLEVDVIGDADKIRSSPSGAVRGTVVAGSAGAVATLFKLLDLPQGGGSAEARLAELAPFRLAGTLSLGTRGENALDLKADGMVKGGRMVSVINLDAGRADWRASPVDLSVAIEGERAGRTLAALASGGAPSMTSDGALGKQAQKLVIKAGGTPAKGMQTLVALNGEGMALDYAGHVTLPAGEPGTTSDGRLRISAENAREALALAGLSFGAGLSNVKLAGEAAVAHDGTTLTLRPKQMEFGDSRLAGVIQVRAAESGKAANLSADVSVDQGSITRLLGPLLAAAAASPAPEPPVPQVGAGSAAQRRPAEPAPVLADASLTPGIWPDQPFDLSVLDRVQGDIKATFSGLRLDDGLTISDAVLAAKLGPDRIDIAQLDGTVVGGQLTTRMSFERAPAGVGLKGSIAIAPKQTEADAASEAAGPKSGLTLGFEGRALSPTALVTDLKGQGKLVLGDVTLSGIGGPAAVGAAAELALQGKGPAGGPELAAAIRAAMKQGSLPLSGLEVPVVIRDGNMKLDRLTMERGEDGRLSFDTSVELATMRFDSEWRIEARVKGMSMEGTAATMLLPAVPIAYSGKLKDFATIDAIVDTSALERELVVRRMERDVDQLERLRRLDQDKAKQEQERQKALEAERAKSATAAPGEQSAAEPAATTAAAAPDDGANGDGAVPPATGADGGDAPLPEAGAADAVDGAAAADGTDRSGLDANRGRAVRKGRPPASNYKRPAQSWNPFVGQ